MRGWDRYDPRIHTKVKLVSPVRRPARVTVPKTDDMFLLLLAAHHLPAPETEIVFGPPRLFRADYLWRHAMLIVEREGGLWSKDERAKAAHAKPMKILRDMEKSNYAQSLGFVYLRFTPEQLDKGQAMPMIKHFLEGFL
jgi:hypothetical protein